MDHLASVLVPLIIFGSITAIILGPGYLRSRDRERMHETLRIAYEKGQPVPPELIAALQSNVSLPAPTTPERDLRRAVVLIALGLGLVGLGYGMWWGLSSVNYIAAYTTGGAVGGAGAIPGLIGVAYLLLWFGKRKTPSA